MKNRHTVKIFKKNLQKNMIKRNTQLNKIKTKK